MIKLSTILQIGCGAVAVYLLLAPTPTVGATISTIALPTTDMADYMSYNQWLAQSFTGDAGASDMRIDSVTLKFDAFSHNSNAVVMITGSTASRAPDLGNVYATMDTTDLTFVPTHSVSTVTLMPEAGSAANQLPADGEYWIVFGASALDDFDNPGLYHWSFLNEHGSYVESDGWKVGAFTAASSTGGAGFVSSSSFAPYSFSISLTSVPEPGVPTLIVLGLGARVFSRRRKLILL